MKNTRLQQYIREPLWQSMEEAKRQTAYGMEVCDVLKISDNEIRWFTGEEDFDRGVDKLWREYHIPLILLSMGSEGSRAYCGTTELEEMLRFANAAASIVTTRRGALRVMPEPEEIQAFLAEKGV